MARLLSSFVVKARRTFEATVLLLDQGHNDEAAILTRTALENAVTLCWLRQDWDRRHEAWLFDSICRQVEWFKGVAEIPGLSDEDRRKTRRGEVVLSASKRALSKKGHERLPDPKKMFGALAADGLYRREYLVLSHGFTHMSAYSAAPDAPDLEWTLSIGVPYKMAALCLWVILFEVEQDRSRGWGAALNEIRAQLDALRPAEGDDG